MRGCACRGSDAGFAHLSCLVETATHGDDNDDTDYRYADDTDRWGVCPICKQDFTGEVRLGLAQARWKLYRTRDIDDLQRLNAADGLASALQECAGDNTGALPLFQEVLAVSRRVDGNDDANTLVSMNNLAALHQKMGHHELARPLFEEALGVQQRVLGKEAPDTLLTTSNLSMLHLRTGHFALALPLAEDTLAVRRRIRGEEHADTLLSKHNLGLLRWHMAHGKFVSFTEIEKRPQKTSRVLGDHCDLQELEIAAKLLKEAAEGHRKVFGSTHQLTLESVRALRHAEQRMTELGSISKRKKDAPSQPSAEKKRRRTTKK
jgi:hypothetical protein